MAERQTKTAEGSEPIFDGKGKRIGVSRKPKEETLEEQGFEEGNSRRKPKEPKETKAEKPTREKKEKVTEKAPPAKPKNDKVTKALSEVEGNAKVLTAARKSPFFKFINKESFEKCVKQQDKIGEGLFRMRVGNLLRGAEKRSKE